jgi:hypothetical protein
VSHNSTISVKARLITNIGRPAAMFCCVSTQIKAMLIRVYLWDMYLHRRRDRHPVKHACTWETQMTDDGSIDARPIFSNPSRIHKYTYTHDGLDQSCTLRWSKNERHETSKPACRTSVAIPLMDWEKGEHWIKCKSKAQHQPGSWGEYSYCCSASRYGWMTCHASCLTFTRPNPIKNIIYPS